MASVASVAKYLETFAQSLDLLLQMVALTIQRHQHCTVHTTHSHSTEQSEQPFACALAFVLRGQVLFFRRAGFVRLVHIWRDILLIAAADRQTERQRTEAYVDQGPSARAHNRRMFGSQSLGPVVLIK